jgi:hypothetical protein
VDYEHASANDFSVVYIPFSQMKENEEEQRNINTLFVAGK